VAAAGGRGGQGRGRATLTFARAAHLTVNRRRLRLLVLGNGVRVHNVVVTLRPGAARGRVMARSRRFAVVRRHHLTLRLPTALARGSYLALASGRDPAGRRIAGRRRFTVG
jgi:hypothetical protein